VASFGEFRLEPQEPQEPYQLSENEMLTTIVHKTFLPSSINKTEGHQKKNTKHMKKYREICSLLEHKNVSDIKKSDITNNHLGYNLERIRLNASLIYMKSLLVGPEDLFNIQVWLLCHSFTDKGEKSPLGKILFDNDFDGVPPPGQEVFIGTKYYDKVKGKYLMALAGRLRPPQIICLRSALLNREDNFNKRACIMKNPEYNPDNNPEIQKGLDNILDIIDYAGNVTEDLLDPLEDNKVIAIAQMDKIQAVCRSGKSLMMLMLMLLCVEDKMNVDKALMDPMCSVNGIPMYNESAHFTSYVKPAITALREYFSLGNNQKENKKMQDRHQGLPSLRYVVPRGPFAGDA